MVFLEIFLTEIYYTLTNIHKFPLLHLTLQPIFIFNIKRKMYD